MGYDSSLVEVQNISMEISIYYELACYMFVFLFIVFIVVRRKTDKRIIRYIVLVPVIVFGITIMLFRLGFWDTDRFHNNVSEINVEFEGYPVCFYSGHNYFNLLIYGPEFMPYPCNNPYAVLVAYTTTHDELVFASFKKCKQFMVVNKKTKQVIGTFGYYQARKYFQEKYGEDVVYDEWEWHDVCEVVNEDSAVKELRYLWFWKAKCISAYDEFLKMIENKGFVVNDECIVKDEQ